MNPNNTGLLLLVHRNNVFGNLEFKGFERLTHETIKLIVTEVVNCELQTLLLEVVKSRSYNTKEMESLISMTRRFDDKVKKRIYKLVIMGMFHIEIMYFILKKLHLNFNTEEQIIILKNIKNCIEIKKM